MHDIRHRVGVQAPINDVYNALATKAGVEGWWTRHITGESEVGGRLGFHFGSPDPAAVMEVTELSPDKRVQWRVVDGPEEWKDTTITFDIKPSGGQTAVVFTHGGWREPNEFMHHCSSRWCYFLLGMRAGLQGGKATPWPDDEPLDDWR